MTLTDEKQAFTKRLKEAQETPSPDSKVVRTPVGELISDYYPQVISPEVFFGSNPTGTSPVVVENIFGFFIEGTMDSAGNKTPGPGILLVLSALAVLVFVRRRAA